MSFPSKSNSRRERRTASLYLRDTNQSCVLILVAIKEHLVREIHPESEAKPEEKSCDWLVEVLIKRNKTTSVQEQVYVELKSRNHLQDAVEQLRQTIERYSPDRTLPPKASYAVGAFSKPQQQRVRLADREFQAKYNSRFKIARDREEVPLTRQDQSQSGKSRMSKKA